MQDNNKTIAKNTLFMYFRMFFTMCVSLYTSRVVLAQLGFSDYGLYNVVGGVIAMFGFLNAAMTTTTSRYITVFLAKGDEQKTRGIFNMSSLIHAGIAVLILLLGETIGLWYLHNKLVIPEGREFATEWLYQVSVITTLLSILSVPYNAAIIANEKMGAFAYIQILDAVLRLIIVVTVQYAPIDKLIYYGTLLAFVSILDITIYFAYCKRHFPETKIHYYWNKSIFKEMTSFIGWSLVGNFSFLFYTQGLNLIINAFCGPAVNAARGIAVQVETAVKQFASNVQIAINPQIIKSYTTQNMQRMFMLISFSSRACFYLLFLISLPILIETDFILRLWLVEYPDHTVNFIRIILISVLLDALINPMYTANLASGKLMIYHLTLSIHMYAFMFVTYLAIKITGIPESVFISLLIATIIGIILRIIIIYRQIGFKLLHYIKLIIVPIMVVSVISVIAPVFLFNMLEEGWVNFLVTTFVSVLSVLFTSYWCGISSQERTLVLEYTRKMISKIKR